MMSTAVLEKPKLILDYNNIFSNIGVARKLLRNKGLHEQSIEMSARAHTQQTVDDILAVLKESVEIQY